MFNGMPQERDISTSISLKDRLFSLVGLNPSMLSSSDDVVNSPETLKNAFTYSLYFVYYDQYTYIEGVLT